MDILNEYREKRNFSLTGEPAGNERAEKSGALYCIQHHVARRDHYDLRLEWAGALLSWAVPKGLPLGVGERRLAVRVEEHPIEYAEFEGTIPKGCYGGGTVMLWDIGTFSARSNVGQGIDRGELKIEIHGKKLTGKWALVRTDGDNWLVIKERDGVVYPAVIPDVSVRSGRTMDEIADGVDLTARRNPFDECAVMLATPAAALPEGDKWRYEIKYDGYRALCYAEGGKCRLISRNGKDFKARFPSVTAAAEELSLGRAMVLDGEITAVDESGRSDFGALARGTLPIEYAVFDLLALDGEDVRKRSYAERRAMLETVMFGAKKPLTLSAAAPAERGKAMLEAASRLKLEGLIAKRTDSGYAGERSKAWVKVKCRPSREFVVGGYALSGTGNLKGLLLGAYGKDGFVYVGRVGSGLSELKRKEYIRELAPLERLKPPFANPPEKRSGESYVWTQPSVVVEVAYSEITADGLLRQPSLKGRRHDKSAKDIALEDTESADAYAEEVEPTAADESGSVCGVTVSNPDRKVYVEPIVTKLDVAHYYAAVAERMLPYLAGRAVSVVRCHNGVDGEKFFKKHPGSKAENVCALETVSSDGGLEKWLGVRSVAELIAQVQSGTVEFHTLGSRAESADTPDMVVFDLDPDEGLSADRVKEGVTDLYEVLERLGLKAFLKTSGGKGYHIAVPLEPKANYGAVTEFAKRTAEYLSLRYPDRYTANIRKAARGGKLFIDWQRNIRGATFVAPYSLRARVGAKVSVPIDFDELGCVAPDGVGISDALERLKKPDPWVGFFETPQRIK